MARITPAALAGFSSPRLPISAGTTSRRLEFARAQGHVDHGWLVATCNCSANNAMPSAPRARIAPRRPARRMTCGTSAPREVVQRDGLVAMARFAEVFCAHDTAAGNASPVRSCGRGETCGQRVAGFRCGDAAQRVGSRRSDFHVLVGQPRSQCCDRLRILADADRIDHADEQVAMELIERLAQQFIHSRIGIGLEGKPRVVREFLVRQQRRQDRE